MKKFIFTEEMDNIIKEKYVNNECSLSQLAKQFGTTIATLSKHVKNDLNIEVINKQNLITYTTEEVLNLYNKGISLTQIAKQLHTDRNRLSRILKEINIKVENKQNITKFNENVFDAINTEQQAYWLGFIFADGYIYDKTKGKNHEYGFNITLKDVDIEHLNKFCKFIQADLSCIKHYGNLVSVSIVNKHLFDSLYALGCTPCKSLTVKFPDIREDLLFDFIEGIFDGDGCLSLDSRKPNKIESAEVSIASGSDEFISKLQEVLISYSFKVSVRQKQTKNSHINICFILSPNKEKFLRKIYLNKTIYLDRKYNKFINLIQPSN